jgi:hypothetical protein
MSINQSVTPGFIDLATFDELEKYLYGGPDATTYFVALVKTSTWFTLIPTVLTKNMGQADFGQEWAASISRAGDYLVHTWLRGNVPSVSVSAAQKANDSTIRWTHNFAHNLIREAAVTFNDLVAARFDSYYLDFWAAFTVPASKQNGYNNMIGNTNLQYVANDILPAFTFNLPLPFFFARDTGVSLPTAALPYNEMRIQINTRDWTELLVLYKGTPPSLPGVQPQSGDVVITGSTSSPKIEYMNVWAEYAIVSNDERKRMGCAPRDILIEQVQTAPRVTFKLGEQSAASTDIRFSHAVKALLFAARNTTVKSDWSNYTTGNIDTSGVLSNSTQDPISNASLLYENTQRLAGLPADYYSLVEPWFKAPTIPTATGYHMYSYSINMYDINPMGSTNYGKLTNVTLDLASNNITAPPNGSSTIKNSYESVICAINHNVIRISGGALGFPVL